MRLITFTLTLFDFLTFKPVRSIFEIPIPFFAIESLFCTHGSLLDSIYKRAPYIPFESRKPQMVDSYIPLGVGKIGPIH